MIWREKQNCVQLEHFRPFDNSWLWNICDVSAVAVLCFSVAKGWQLLKRIRKASLKYQIEDLDWQNKLKAVCYSIL